MATYDDSILQQHADTLYRAANRIVTNTALAYGVVGFFVSALLVGGFSAADNLTSTDNVVLVQGIVVVLLTAVAVCLGVISGREKAFRLKLQAQTVLCQRQIELNTRK